MARSAPSRSRGHRLVQAQWLLLAADATRHGARGRELRADQVLGQGATRGSTCPRSARSRSRSTRCGRTRTVELAPDARGRRARARRQAPRRGPRARSPRASTCCARRAGIDDARARHEPQQLPYRRGPCVVRLGIRRARRAAEAALDLDLSAARAQHRRPARLGIRGALDFWRLRRDARGRGRRRQGQLRRAAARCARWPLEVVIAMTAKNEKEVGSRSGMTRSAKSSPYYRRVGSDAAAGSRHRARRDSRAATSRRSPSVAEHNCLKMHAAAIAARPPLLYWNGATRATACTQIRRLRARRRARVLHDRRGPASQGDLRAGRASYVERALRAVPGVLKLLDSALGPGAELLLNGVVARAPGKLVALGEYAVLEGAPALVLAVDRYARRRSRRAATADAISTTRAAAVEERPFRAGGPSGVALVDLVSGAPRPRAAWTRHARFARRSSSAERQARARLERGALTAWAGAFARLRARPHGVPAAAADARRRSIELHRAVSGRAGQRARRRGELHGRARSISA